MNRNAHIERISYFEPRESKVDRQAERIVLADLIQEETSIERW